MIRRTASAFSASDNGSEAIIASAAENESALIGRDRPPLAARFPVTWCNQWCNRNEASLQVANNSAVENQCRVTLNHLVEVQILAGQFQNARCHAMTASVFVVSHSSCVERIHEARFRRNGQSVWTNWMCPAHWDGEDP